MVDHGWGVQVDGDTTGLLIGLVCNYTDSVCEGFWPSLGIGDTSGLFRPTWVIIEFRTHNVPP